MNEILFLIVGILLGGIPAWIIAKLKFSSTESEGSEEELEQLQNQYSKLQHDFNSIDKEKAAIQAQLKLITEDRDQRSAELTEERNKLQFANSRLAKAEETFKNMNEKFATQKAELEELQKKFTLEFENIANKILDEKSKKFTELNRTHLDIVLNPLNEKIKDFGEKVEKIYKAESEERVTLKTEIKHLVELNKQISQEANNLAVALKGDKKKQGNWGEYILETILERSGLVKGREYDTQQMSTNANGESIKPDVIVYLPDKKHVIIDSKVSLVAYEAFVNAESEEDGARFLKEHLLSVKNHIKSLGEKSYYTAKDLNTPEFILMFIPIESSFSTAVQAGEDLFNFAWEKRIVLVSPSTLFASLSTIASVWKQERQKNNVMKIAEIGGKLYDQFVRFVEDMKEIEKGIQKAKDSYDNAFKRLSHGNGNLVSGAQKMKELGAKATKSLDQDILDQASENILEK